MELDHEPNVAVDERPLARPLTGNQQLPPEAEWDDEESEEDDDPDDVATTSETDEETEKDETAEVEEDEDEGFADDERDPFVGAPAALVSPVETGSEDDDHVEHVETRSPITLEGAVYARIADCLRAAIASADEKLGPARELAEREPFYTGFVTVLEAQRRRYVRALERAQAQAATATIVPAEADEVEVEPAQLV